MSFHINGAGTGSANEKIRITSDGYLHLGNSGHGTNSVGGQAITGQDYNPRFKIYNTTASSWLMHLRNDNATNPNGILLTANIKRKNFALSCTFQKVCFRRKNIAQLVSDEKSIKKPFTYRLHTKDLCIFIVFILGQSLLILQFVEP